MLKENESYMRELQRNRKIKQKLKNVLKEKCKKGGKYVSI